jgi:hypothetical protein
VKYPLPKWASSLSKRWSHSGVPKPKQEKTLLKRGIGLLVRSATSLPKSPISLPEQPFDLHLLNCSPLYHSSRDLYLRQGGRFLPTLVTSPRTLSSAMLLEQLIEYSPIEKELVWSATDPIEGKNPNRLLSLRTYSSSLFHEQNHRILWKFLPPPPKDPDELRRFMNFSESLVIITDMALADQLGPKLASLFYLIGVTYDPGTTVFQELENRRKYRNYLQAALHATYLNLEYYDPKSILKVISHLFPMLGHFGQRATLRSTRLDRQFVEMTNPQWQKKHRSTFLKKLSNSTSPVLRLQKNPLDNRQQYLIAEKWFDYLGV